MSYRHADDQFPQLIYGCLDGIESMHDQVIAEPVPGWILAALNADVDEHEGLTQKARLHFFFSSRRRHTRCLSDWSSDVCSSDLAVLALAAMIVVVVLLARWTGIAVERAVIDACDLPTARRSCRETPSHLPGVRATWLRSEERRVGKECRARCTLSCA